MAHDILIVDDETDIRALISGLLQDEGYATREASNSDEALAQISSRQPSLIIQDIWLEGSHLDGLGILRRVARNHPDVPVVMISGHGTIETAVDALKEGAYDFIEKPFQVDRLLVVVERAIESSRLRQENRELRIRAGDAEELVGNSAAIQQIRQAIGKVGPTGSRVLITGPAGAGKEVVARLIHSRSSRSVQPFVVVNCATMRPEAFETELFGIEPAANGEDDERRRVGVFERAHGGTLLLDEVADMPLETQGKIVRVLQEQTFERVGGNHKVSVDVRVIATTNRDLEHEIVEGNFREDLFYRLNVVPIPVPALARRRDDIPLLARHFMARSASATGVRPRPFGEDAMAALQSYAWPGNVRQLRNVVDWVMIMAPGEGEDPVTAEMLPPEIGANAPESLSAAKAAEIMALPLREARELFEKQYLEAQIQRFEDNISKTAKFVGMERSALHRKLKSLGIHGEKS
ncbi:MAG: sigma-54 dependent transcriptional regulator [Rhodospirillales bacterium]